MDRIKSRNLRADAFANGYVGKYLENNPINCKNFEYVLKNYKPNYMCHTQTFGTLMHRAIGNPDANSEIDEKILGFIISLFFHCTQQFCFWVSPTNPLLRTGLTSSSIAEECNNTDWKESHKNLKTLIDVNAVNLRKERLEILEKAYDHAMCTYDTNVADLVYYLVNFSEFKNDFFFKKGNLFLMELNRLSVYLNELKKSDQNRITSQTLIDLRDIEWNNYIGPAIDYQIPKMLVEFGIIKFPKSIQDIIMRGELIIKDSPQELIIRCISLIAVKTLAKQFNITIETVDNVLFFNRKVSCTQLPHACLTTAY